MIDVELVLNKLAEVGLVRLSKPAGDYFSIYCPIHKDGTERKPSCGVLMRDKHKGGQRYPAGWCHCFTCGYAKPLPDLVTDLLKARNMSGNGLEWLKEHIPGFDGLESDIELLVPNELIDTLNTNYAVNYVYDLAKPKTATYLPEEELASYRYTVPYMYERGLTDELIERYDIGFDPNHVPPGKKQPIPCITFPVRDKDGNALFCCRRSIQGKYFNYPTDVQKPVYGIYELPPGTTRVVVCESCLNALTVVKYGDPAVALLGTGNPYQIWQLKQLGVKEFIIGLDPDEAGRKGTARLMNALKSVAIVWTFEGIPEGKDLNDLDYETYKSLRLV